MRKKEGITLVALIITVVVMLILAGVAINLTIGENGIFQKSEQSVGVHNKQEATEKVNLKITYTQMRIYSESQRMPTLQEIANDFCKDNEIEYVELASKKVASLENIEVEQAKSIFTKLKQYPYEFEINDSLQLASIDGVKLANTDNTSYEELSKKITNLENAMQQKDSVIESLETRLAKLENETIVGKRTKLTQDDFTMIEVVPTTTQVNKNYGNIKLIDSIKNYKYLEIKIESKNTTENIIWGEKTIFIAIDSITYNNSDTFNWSSTLISLTNDFGVISTTLGCHFKNEREMVISSAQSAYTNQSVRIKEIYGIK